MSQNRLGVVLCSFGLMFELQALEVNIEDPVAILYGIPETTFVFGGEQQVLCL